MQEEPQKQEEEEEDFVFNDTVEPQKQKPEVQQPAESSGVPMTVGLFCYVLGLFGQ